LKDTFFIISFFFESNGRSAAKIRPLSVATRRSKESGACYKTEEELKTFVENENDTYPTNNNKKGEKQAITKQEGRVMYHWRN
jgi:hypothetical protein